MKLRLDRVLTRPSVRVLNRTPDTTRLAIDGLVCNRICAARTARALRRIDGVNSVAVDFDSGIATVEGRPLPDAMYDAALQRAVACQPLRRLLDDARRAWVARHDRRVAA